ncbi:hypothetical protein GCM10023224_32760 [Streptomonospora halophila]|uniref:DUF4352 domain-containing protein n=1 Tax=Streptomonospora halophila TaxID=427369 RepID=A0ABP9GKP6_9ACTN
MAAPDAPQQSAVPSSPRARPRWIIPAIAVVAAFVIGCGTGWLSYQRYLTAGFEQAAQNLQQDLGQGAGAAPEQEQAGEAEPAGPPDPTSPSDGLFEYTITGIEAADSYNDQDCMGTYQPADGARFLVMDIEAENVGKSASMPAVDPGEVRGYSADGRSFETHTEICTFADEINPGTSTGYDVVFEVPADVAFAVIELASYEAPEVAVVEAP